MFVGIKIEYYHHDPILTHSKTLIYGALISTVEDSITGSVKTTIVPGTGVYCSIYVTQDTYIEISDGTPTVTSSRRFNMAAGERRDFLLGPQETNTKTIGYVGG